MNVNSLMHGTSLASLIISKTKYEEVEAKVKAKDELVQELLKDVFRMYKPQEVMMAFNGGKDCTVVLHMLDRYIRENNYLEHLKLPTLYIEDADSFKEVDMFIEDCTKQYSIELIKKRGPIKKALEVISSERPLIKAVFMGCRRTDPYCKDLKVMQLTDPGYPPLMRVNPIIDWSCRDIWQYIFIHNVPYCTLYQRGYTSIGNCKNTKPNPYLKIIDSTSGHILDYRPGHELLDNDELERAGRV